MSDSCYDNKELTKKHETFLKGKQYEKLFADKLNEFEIIFFHIDQGLQCLKMERKDDYFCNAIKNANAKRPDFLIYRPQIGNLFIDIKSRTPIERIIEIDVEEGKASDLLIIDEGQIECFISLIEIQPLNVWFVCISKKDNKKIFYFLPVTKLKEYIDKLKEELGKEYEFLLQQFFIRIPNPLFYEFTEKNDIEEAYEHFRDNDFDNLVDIKTEAEEYKLLHKKLLQITKILDNNNIKNNKDDLKIFLDKPENKITCMFIDEIYRYRKK